MWKLGSVGLNDLHLRTLVWYYILDIFESQGSLYRKFVRFFDFSKLFASSLFNFGFVSFQIFNIFETNFLSLWKVGHKLESNWKLSLYRMDLPYKMSTRSLWYAKCSKHSSKRLGKQNIGSTFRVVFGSEKMWEWNVRSVSIFTAKCVHSTE